MALIPISKLPAHLASLMISNGEDIVRVSRLMGHANAAFTLNVYSHMLPREHDPSGDRLASLVFGNKMETDSDPETELELSDVENLSKSAVRSQDFGDTLARSFFAKSGS
ncbi:MAG: hypothetical protein E6K22_03565 [Gammaproteobacteria bacterium]|nr:MAG: hypothetical protein E6K22_03565 [Gammaproteobacteria bacterium]